MRNLVQNVREMNWCLESREKWRTQYDQVIVLQLEDLMGGEKACYLFVEQQQQQQQQDAFIVSLLLSNVIVSACLTC